MRPHKKNFDPAKLVHGTVELTDCKIKWELVTLDARPLSALPFLILVRNRYCKAGMAVEQFSLECVTYAVSFVKIGTLVRRKTDGNYQPKKLQI